MRLKSLRLSGFKSFANSTTFHFKHNITAIVGPNGCGKSNVIDAIRWVLGETSAKQLRGGAMSDVIFAGSQDKTAKSLASVELTFEHTQDEQTGIRHELNLYHELSVRRQVNKNGKSDYFINGTRCRRRDVVDIFLGTGLGSRSYAVIEQGMIGRIVDSSPMQLREFIEEGAGVSRYQTRRLETQKQLEKAQENLSRLNDLQSELQKQHNTLSRQAETAKKYQALNEQLQALEQDMLIYQLYDHKRKEQALHIEHKAINDEVLTIQKKVSDKQASIDKLNQRIAEQQWLKDDARDNHYQEQLKLQQAQQAINQHHGQLQQLIDKQQNITEQQQELSKQLQEIEEKHQLEQQQLQQLTPQKETLHQQKNDIQNKLIPLEKDWQAIHAQRDELQKQQQQLEKQQALSKQAISHITDRQKQWTNKQTTWQQAWDKLSEHTSIDDLTKNLADNHNRLHTLQNQQDDLADSLEDEQNNFSRIKESINHGQSELQKLEKHHASLMSEYNTLHAMVTSKPQGKIDNSTQNNSQTINLNSLKKLTDSIELSQQGRKHADSLDNWLGLWLDVVIDPSDDLQKLWLTLIAQDKPKATDNAVLTTVSEIVKPSQAMIDNGFIPLTSLIKLPQLTLWQSAYLWNIDGTQGESLRDIQQQLKNLPSPLPTGTIVLTNTGWIVSKVGIIHLSKLVKNNPNSHFLQQREQHRQRLEELEDLLNPLEDEIDDKQKALKRQQANHDDLQMSLQELTAQANNLQQSIHQTQHNISQLTNQSDRHHSDKQRLEHEKEQLDNEQSDLAEQIDTLQQQMAEGETQLAKINEQLAEVEQQRSQISQLRYDTKQASDDIERKLQGLQLETSQLTVSLQHIDKQKLQLANNQERSEKQLSQSNDDIDKLEAQLPQLEKSVKEQQSLCHERQITLDEYQGQLTELQTTHTAQTAELNQEQNELAKQQQQLASISTQLAIAKEHLHDSCQRIDALVANEKYSLNTSSSKLLAEFTAQNQQATDDKQAQQDEKQQQQKQQEYQKLQMQIAKIGAVNLMAVEELAQVEERLSPLSEQTDDILASIDKLTNAINTIDDKTKELFLQMLDQVNQELSKLFSKVFGGGQASLTMIEDDKLPKKDQWRAGLELMAQPKGKKNSRLAVLSGGEKTLTALSLIFAIFKQHPAPFCLLDEVDAPLDDANVNRFTGLIQELANDLQFIFISHNKLTMQIADELKGVTMPQAGISSLVSVSMDELDEYID